MHCELQGDLGVRRARYEARWHAFAAARTEVTYAAVPWIADDAGADIEAIVFYSTSGALFVPHQHRASCTGRLHAYFASETGACREKIGTVTSRCCRVAVKVACCLCGGRCCSADQALANHASQNNVYFWSWFSICGRRQGGATEAAASGAHAVAP